MPTIMQLRHTQHHLWGLGTPSTSQTLVVPPGATSHRYLHDKRDFIVRYLEEISQVSSAHRIRLLSQFAEQQDEGLRAR